MLAELSSRRENGVALDVLVWRLHGTMRCAATTVVGGGVGHRDWVLNVEVGDDYDRTDVAQHLAELARTFELSGQGVGMLTAAPVRHRQGARVDDVQVEATVGLSHPVWAADHECEEPARSAGTINIVAFMPVRLDDGALLNALVTATEAKSQALWDASILGTGTPSDAVCVFCPVEGDSKMFGGPRSEWGSRLARAVHQAVFAGATERTS
jgi:adenosylcobinamide amidohydrolase